MEYESIITYYIFDGLVTFLIYHVNRSSTVKVAKLVLEKAKKVFPLTDPNSFGFHTIIHENP
jgi:hypothetical protein